MQVQEKRIREQRSGKSQGPEYSLPEIEGTANREFLFRRPDL